MNDAEFDLKLYSYNEIIKYFKENNLKNVILFSQARSGSTFVTENLPPLMDFNKNQIFNEVNFLNVLKGLV